MPPNQNPNPRPDTFSSLLRAYFIKKDYFIVWIKYSSTSTAQILIHHFVYPGHKVVCGLGMMGTLNELKIQLVIRLFLEFPLNYILMYSDFPKYIPGFI